MIEVYGHTRGTENTEDIVIGTFDTEEQAETFCDQWGWNYDDGERSYTMIF